MIDDPNYLNNLSNLFQNINSNNNMNLMWNNPQFNSNLQNIQNNIDLNFYNNNLGLNNSNLFMNYGYSNNNNMMNIMLQQIINNCKRLIEIKKQNIQNNERIIDLNDSEDEEIITPEENEIKDALANIINEPNIQNINTNNTNNNANLNKNDVEPLFIETVMQLDPNILNGLGNNIEGKWGNNEKRGERPYYPPYGWSAYGINVLNKYDNKNNDWLSCDGRPGEWCVAYHGACRGMNSEEVKRIIKLILVQNLKPGSGQARQNDNDLNHPDKKLGLEFIVLQIQMFWNLMVES
jgi:hypothetical protein